MGTIVVATDGSQAATAALSEAVGLARETGDSIVAVTVWRALQGDYGLAYPSAAMLTDLLDAERAHAEAVLDGVAALADKEGVVAETVLATGDPAQEICRLAAERDARLIAVGARGHGSVVSLLVGSVSAAVIRGAPCPVLVVPDRSTTPEAGSRSQAVAHRD